MEDRILYINSDPKRFIPELYDRPFIFRISTIRQVKRLDLRVLLFFVSSSFLLPSLNSNTSLESLTKRAIICRIQGDINKILPLSVFLIDSSSYKWATVTEEARSNTTTNWILNISGEDGRKAAALSSLHRTNCWC